MAHKKADHSHTPGGRKRRGHRANPLLKTTLDTQHSVTAVLFHGSNKLASSGAADGTVKLWDLRRTYTHRNDTPQPWHTFTQTGDPARPFGFTCLVSDPFQSCLFASCTDDIIYKYDCSGLKKNPVCAFSGHRNSTFYVKASVGFNGRYLASGSSCGNAFIWEIDRPESQPLQLSGHSKEVTAVSWCPTQPDKLATCSDNNDIRLWRVVRKRRSIPGEFIGLCEQYRGEGHLKASEVMKKYTKDATEARKEDNRTPLKAVHNLPKTSLQTPYSARKQPKPKSPNEKQIGLLRFLTPKSSPNGATAMASASTPVSPPHALSSENSGVKICTDDNCTLDFSEDHKAKHIEDGESSVALLSPWKTDLNRSEKKRSRTPEVEEPKPVSTCLELQNSPCSSICSISSVNIEATPERGTVAFKSSQNRKRKLQCLSFSPEECAVSAGRAVNSPLREQVKKVRKQQNSNHVHQRGSVSSKGKWSRGKNSSSGAGHQKQVVDEGVLKTCRRLQSYFSSQ